MPSLKDFGNFQVYMYFEDHGIPHFHVVAAEFYAAVAIEDLSMLAGELPPGVLRKARKWAAENRPLLRRKWREYSE